MTTDDPKDGSADGQPRTRKDTPIISVGGPEGAANRLAQLGANLRRSAGIVEQVERLVRAHGFNPQTRALLGELADHFENHLPPMAQGTGRTLRRLADLG